ncbi:MAG: ABC transporter permease [Bacteroidales bacterium]|nr:ABC transporter permease [Bacteroidales bacterium]
MQIRPADRIAVYFPQEPPRMRAFVVAGIYETGFDNLDKLMALADIGHIQKLNGWGKDQISGYEVLANNLGKLDDITWEMRSLVGNHFYEDGSKLKVENIYQQYPQIFDWLGLLDTNALVLIFIILAVAGINMVSGLIVLILERTRFIGLLKAVGYENYRVKRIFLYQSAWLIAKGLLWGNAIGLSIGYLQNRFQLLKLEQTSYYLTSVPVHFHLADVALLNLGALVLITLVLLVPATIISRVDPVKSLRFD